MPGEHLPPLHNGIHSLPSTMRLDVGSLSVELNLWNPLYAVAPLVLLVVSIPLAIFATITTSVAISLLACRVAIVYVQLTIALLGAWIDPRPSKFSPTIYPTPPSSSPTRTPPARQRPRRSTIASSSSSQETIVPANKGKGRFVPLPNATETTRDFEGVGGWRTPGNDDEEALWMGMNSRLHLSADITPRRHQRTGTSSPSQRRSWSPEALRSPVHSRARTPVRFAIDDEEEDYFSPHPSASMRPSNSTLQADKDKRRRKSESSSSSASSGLMMASKEEGD
jgi:hypothetical protein